MSLNNSEPTIQRCPHDRENPYTMVLNTVVRDNSISPNCRLVLIHLLSNKDGWVINLKALHNQFKDHLGRDKIYSIVNEAIKAGYMKREEYTDSKNLKRYKYFLSETPKFKKFLRCPDSQYTEIPLPENQGSKEDEVFLDSSCPKELKKKHHHQQELPEQQEKKVDDDDPLRDFDILIEELEKRKTPVFSEISNRASLLKLSKKYSARLVGQIIYRFAKDKPKVRSPMGWLTEAVKEEFELFKYKQRNK